MTLRMCVLLIARAPHGAVLPLTGSFPSRLCGSSVAPNHGLLHTPSSTLYDGWWRITGTSSPDRREFSIRRSFAVRSWCCQIAQYEGIDASSDPDVRLAPLAFTPVDHEKQDDATRNRRTAPVAPGPIAGGSAAPMKRKISSGLSHPNRDGLARQAFPETSWTLLGNAVPGRVRSADALNEFAERYYGAVRAFIAAIVRDSLDADDLTQRFFETVVLSGRLFTRVDAEKGRFRPYLKQAIRNFLVDEYRRQAREVNPDVRPDALDDGWNDIVVEPSPGPDEAMLRAWACALVAIAVARLESTCEENNQTQHFQLFAHRYLVDPDDPPSWGQVGKAFGLGEKIARSRAETAARHFRSLLRDLIASDIGSARDVDEELQSVIAIL
jgi:RNA polymerase sigma factor (sigma-70 family)